MVKLLEEFEPRQLWAACARRGLIGSSNGQNEKHFEPRFLHMQKGAPFSGRRK